MHSSEVCVDQIRFAPPTGATSWSFYLEHQEAGRLQRAGQPDPVATGAFQPDDHPGPGGVVNDPLDRIRIPDFIICGLPC